MKKNKIDNKIKRPKTPYLIYWMETRPIIKEEMLSLGVNIKPTELTVEVAKRWNNLSDDQKEVYRQKASKASNVLNVLNETNVLNDYDNIKLTKEQIILTMMISVMMVSTVMAIKFILPMLLPTIHTSRPIIPVIDFYNVSNVSNISNVSNVSNVLNNIPIGWRMIMKALDVIMMII
jgi:hypothetical protein